MHRDPTSIPGTDEDYAFIEAFFLLTRSGGAWSELFREDIDNIKYKKPNKVHE
jgi:hypothetical protein